MKIKVLLLTVLTAGVLSFRPIAELPIGATIPRADVRLKDVSGKAVSFNDAKMQNGLLVMFSCNTCPYVMKNQGRTKEISAYALKNNIGVVLVNSNEAQRGGDDSFQAMQQYAKAQGYNWYYVVDDKNAMADAFGASRTPENYLFDKDGHLVYSGAIDDNPDAVATTRKHLLTAIDEMLSGKEVSVKTSRSVGCQIKRAK